MHHVGKNNGADWLDTLDTPETKPTNHERPSKSCVLPAGYVGNGGRRSAEQLPVPKFKKGLGTSVHIGFGFTTLK